MKNPYKTMSLILAGLLLISILANIYFSRPSEIDEFISVMNNPPTIAQTQSNLTIHPDHTGAIISRDEAIEKMKHFKVVNGGSSPILKTHAFAFGINNLKKMTDAIYRANASSGSSNAEELIQGVRAYLTWTGGPSPNGYLDVLIVPVLGNGIDYIQIDKSNIFDEDMILNTSAPCPNNCDPPNLLNSND